MGWWGVVLLALCLAGCSNAPYRGKDVLGADEFVIDSYRIQGGKLSILELEGKPCDELDPALLDEYPDTIEEGDVLKVELYHPTRTDLMAAVRTIGNQIGYIVSDGAITLPNLPPFHVAGLTLAEAQEALQRAYDLDVADSEVFLAYKERKLRRVELAGMVQVPTLPVNGRVRLFDILAEARVPVDANLFKSYLVRAGKLIPVDMYKLVVDGDMTQNVVMRGGDKLYIAPAKASTLMVMGEVNREKVIDLPAGFMPLREALALAGGIPYTGDKGYIQIIRGNILRPKIYTLNWEHVIRLPTSSLLLMPGDIVYVAATPIAQWNRFVTQIFPTLTGIELFRKGVAGVVAIQ